MTSLAEQSFKAAHERRESFEKATNIALEAAITNALGSLGMASQAARAESQYRAFVGVPYLAIQKIAERVAGQNVRAARVVGKGPNPNRRRIQPHEVVRAPDYIKKEVGQGQLEMVPDHQVLEAFSHPNDLHTQFHLFYIAIASMKLTGLSYWHMFVPNDTAEEKIQMWPLPAHWVTPIDDSKEGFRAGYKVKPPGSSKEYLVEPADMAPFMLPNPENPRLPLSPVSTHIDALISDREIHRAQRETYTLGIHPKLLVQMGKSLPGPGGTPGVIPVVNAAQRRQLRHVVRQLLQASNQWEPFILDGMIENIVKFSLTPKEMDFMESGEFIENRLLKIWGVSPIILGHVKGVNKATAAAADKIFTDNTVNPLIQLLSQIMTIWVAPRFEPDGRLRIWIDKAKPSDPDLDEKRSTTAYNEGSITKNERRADLGLPPDKNGDVYKVMNMMSTDFLPADIAQSGGRAMTVAAKSTVKLTRNIIEIAHLKQLAKHSKDLSLDLAVFFNKQVNAIIRELNALKGQGSGVAKLIFRPRDWDAPLADAARPSMANMMAEAAFAEMELFGLAQQGKASGAELKRIEGLDLPKDRKAVMITNRKELTVEDVLVPLPEETLAVIDEILGDTFAQEYWTGINDTVAGNVEMIMNKAFEEGLSVPDTAKLIREELGGPGAAWRAIRIARTEMTGAANAGHQAAMEELTGDGLIEGKEWLSVLGTTTRDHHAAANAQQVPTAADFNVGGEDTPYPGHWSMSAGNRISCQCSHLSVTVMDATRE